MEAAAGPRSSCRCRPCRCPLIRGLTRSRQRERHVAGGRHRRQHGHRRGSVSRRVWRGPFDRLEPGQRPTAVPAASRRRQRGASNAIDARYWGMSRVEYERRADAQGLSPEAEMLIIVIIETGSADRPNGSGRQQPFTASSGSSARPPWFSPDTATVARAGPERVRAAAASRPPAGSRTPRQP